MAFTAVTTKIDQRHKVKRPVWETVTVFSIDAGDGSTELPEEVEINGMLEDIVIVVGAAAGITGTVDVDFDDSNDFEFDANAGLAESSTTVVAVSQPVNNVKIRCNPSDDPTSGTWTVTVYMRGI